MFVSQVFHVAFRADHYLPAKHVTSASHQSVGDGDQRSFRPKQPSLSPLWLLLLLRQPTLSGSSG